jgi:sugar-specific transcriptional regulator TrmB
MQIQEDLVKKLAEFELTVNQAKVYLCIIQSGTVSVGKISKITKLHRQDIYKILPKIEEKGLITKTIEKPFRFQAIPLETALHQLVLKEQEKSSARLHLLEENFKELVNSLKDQPIEETDARFNLLTTDDSIRNRAQLSFSRLEKEIELITNLDLLLAPLTRLHEFVGLLSEKKAKTYLLAVTRENAETLKKIIKQIGPNPKFFKVKHMPQPLFNLYLILDRKEVWIATEQTTESGFPCILWTNDSNIVRVYEENFENCWNNPLALKIYPKESIRSNKEKDKKRKVIFV